MYEDKTKAEKMEYKFEKMEDEINLCSMRFSGNSITGSRVVQYTQDFNISISVHGCMDTRDSIT
jgi:pyruvate/2-oxoacid:ferredoxin oxidoreductase alpha subunit